MELCFARSAIDDLQAIQIYINNKVSHGLEMSLFEPFWTIQPCCLSKHPDVGRVVPEFNQANIRELIHTPFRIVYLRQTIELVIIRVWRGERMLELPTETL